MNTKGIGNYGEQIAAQYLLNKGYRIIECNYLTKIGEIDIVAEDGNTLVFVEVKYRKTTKYGQPYDAITPKKQQAIRRTAQLYMKHRHIADRPVRIDVLSILHQEDIPEIIHFVNAF